MRKRVARIKTRHHSQGCTAHRCMSSMIEAKVGMFWFDVANVALTRACPNREAFAEALAECAKRDENFRRGKVNVTLLGLSCLSCCFAGGVSLDVQLWMFLDSCLPRWLGPLFLPEMVSRFHVNVACTARTMLMNVVDLEKDGWCCACLSLASSHELSQNINQDLAELNQPSMNSKPALRAFNAVSLDQGEEVPREVAAAC